MNKEERQWLERALRFGGGFVKHFAETCFHADDDNFEMLHPVLIALMEKYPYYSDSSRW